jgi:predicted cobalt transporter CbtA
MDSRLMGNVAAGTIASAPRDTNPAGDALLPAYPGSAPVAPADTDSDGMPDAWETANGLNPGVANTNARTLSAAGYTDLEVYLHELSAGRVSGWNAG